MPTVHRLTAPLTILFRPWVMWPVLAAFAGVFWFVLIDKGVASATAQAFHSPGLLLLVLVVNVAILVYALLSMTYRILYRIEMWMRKRLIGSAGRPGTSLSSTGRT